MADPADVLDLEAAKRLVEDAALNWDGWPERGGTKMLRDLFRERYEPKQVAAAPSPEAATVARMVAAGHLAKPCGLCPPDAEFCEYGGARGHQRYATEQAARIAEAAQPAKPMKPVVSLHNVRRLMANAATSHAEEQRRKREQLERVGMA